MSSYSEVEGNQWKFETETRVEEEG